MTKTIKLPHKEIFVAAIIGGFIIYWLTTRGENVINDISDDMGV